MKLFWRNDGYVIIDGLSDFATGLFVNDATLTLALKDQQGQAITGATAISMTYKTDSDGTYLALVPYTVQLTSGTQVLATVTCANYPGIRFDAIPIDIVKRTGVT